MCLMNAISVSMSCLSASFNKDVSKVPFNISSAVSEQPSGPTNAFRIPPGAKSLPCDLSNFFWFNVTNSLLMVRSSSISFQTSHLSADNTHVCIVKQEDGAGLHTDGTYINTMNDLFRLKDWLIFNQPSQSPVTNIHDACIFPMMSKAVSTEQALTFGSRMLVGEQLNQTVMKVWNDKTNLVAMSRAFAGHSQIVCAIIEHKGDNKYLSEKGGLSFGVRKTYICDEDGDGVRPMTLAPENEAETTQGLLLSSNFERGMKYTPPDIRTLKNGQLTKEMKEVLNMYIPLLV